MSFTLNIMVKKKILSELKKIKIVHSTKEKSKVEAESKFEEKAKLAVKIKAEEKSAEKPKADEKPVDKDKNQEGVEEGLQKKDFSETILQENIGFTAPVIDEISTFGGFDASDNKRESLEETADSVFLDHAAKENALYSSNIVSGNYSGNNSYGFGNSYESGQIGENPLLISSGENLIARRGFEGGFSGGARRDSNPWETGRRQEGNINQDMQRFQMQEKYRAEKEKESTRLPFQEKKRESF